MVSNAQTHLANEKGSFRMTRSTLALIAVLLAGSASAQIVVDASDYPVGTNISNAIPGVTLSYITLSSPGDRPSVGTSLPSVLYTATPLSIASSEDGDPNSVLGGPTGGDTFQKLILLQFAQPVSYFSFVALSDSGDPVVADIFNTSGIDIANPLSLKGVVLRHIQSRRILSIFECWRILSIKHAHQHADARFN